MAGVPNGLRLQGCVAGSGCSNGGRSPQQPVTLLHYKHLVQVVCINRCLSIPHSCPHFYTAPSSPEPLPACQVESLGRRHPRAHIAPRPADVATFCYTSGTTGVPKGAVLTHSNLVASAAGTVAVLTDWLPGERHISYLPLAHIYERVNLVTCTHLGSAVGFYSGNVQVRKGWGAQLWGHWVCVGGA